MPESLSRQLTRNSELSCLYCSNSADTTEHVMPAAFGSFKNSPTLPDRLCSDCNNKRLGLLDQQLARCGPEGFLRTYYGIRGRKGHDAVNPFMRGSAGGKRVEATSFDPLAGREVAVEIGSNGRGTQLCAMTIIENQSGKHHHIPLHEGMTAAQLRDAFDKCHAIQPIDAAFAYHPDELVWIKPLFEEVWPTVTFPTDQGKAFSKVIERPVIKFQVTDRYHRAFAKIGFHYFLSQFSEFSGRENFFAGIRRFIAEDGDRGENRASQFIVERTTPLLSTVARGLVPPTGWKAHVLGAEIRPDRFIAHVQMFLTCDWPSPIRTIVLAKPATRYTHQAAGHLFLYNASDSSDGEAGEAKPLSVQVI